MKSKNFVATFPLFVLHFLGTQNGVERICHATDEVLRVYDKASKTDLRKLEISDANRTNPKQGVNVLVMS